MTLTRFLGAAEKLDLVLDVLRANGLHQEACTRHRRLREENELGMLMERAACDCWLSEPSEPPALPDSELRVDLYRMGGVAPLRSVRVTHLPTGIQVSATAATELRACAEAKADLAEKVATSRAVTVEDSR